MRISGLLVILLLLSGCAASPPSPKRNQFGDTLSQIGTRPVVIVHDREEKEPILKAIARYRGFLEKALPGAMEIEVARRRIADLYLLAGDALIARGDDTDKGHQYYLKAAQTYAKLIKAASPGNHADLDELLYFQAQSYAGAADEQSMALSLGELTRLFPASRFAGEARFRLGEFAFSQSSYEEAADEFQAALASPKTRRFERQARFKLAWARYKQTRFQAAADQFAKLIKDRLDTLSQQGQTLATTATTERVLIEDSLRGLLLAMERLGGIDAVDPIIKILTERHADHVYRILADRARDKGDIATSIEILSRYDKRYPYTLPAARFLLRIHDMERGLKIPARAWATLARFGDEFGSESPYWQHHSPRTSPWLASRLREILPRLARHAHAETHEEGRPTGQAFASAAKWYQSFLELFPDDPGAPDIRYLLAELFYQSGQFIKASEQYEAFSLQYPGHAKAAEAAYAAILARRRASGNNPSANDMERQIMRFIARYPGHSEAARLVLKMSQDLFDEGAFSKALPLADRVLNLKPVPQRALLRNAWLIKGEIAFREKRFKAAELAFGHVLEISGPNEDQIRERLAANIYQQGKAAQGQGNDAQAIQDFLRAGDILRDSKIGITALLDASSLMIKDAAWQDAVETLHKLQERDLSPRQQTAIQERLATALVKSGNKAAAADAFSRISEDTSLASEVRAEALKKSATLHDETGHFDRAISEYRRYISRYPESADTAQRFRKRLADIYGQRQEYHLRRYWLKRLIKADRKLPPPHQIAARASLELADFLAKRYHEIPLTIPLKDSMRRKRAAMEGAIDAYGQAAEYAFEDVTTAATHHLGALFNDLSIALLASPKPSGLSADDLDDYNALLEEQAFPIEEQAIELYEDNVKRIRQGIYDTWVRASITALENLFPARYKRQEIHESFIPPESH